MQEVLRCRRLFPEWQKLTVNYLGFQAKYPFRVTLPTGEFELQTWNDVRTFWLVWCAETYPIVESDRVILDAGANIGTFTIYALVRAPRSYVIAIEPAPDTFDRLRRMIEMNQMQERAKLMNAALGRTEGITRIDLRPESQFRRTGSGQVEVRQIPLAKLMDQRIDLLKMDIEGAELEALSSSDLAEVGRIVMEFHPNVVLGELVAALRLRKFAIEKVREDGAGYGILWAIRSSTTNSDCDVATHRERPVGNASSKGAALGA